MTAMLDYIYAEAMLQQLACDRGAHMLRQARLKKAMEGAVAQRPSARGRRHRERVARFLNALAIRLAPQVGLDVS